MSASLTASRYDGSAAFPDSGESWHNMHHSDPTSARHGADPGQGDISAAVIRIFERVGWATGVRWPTSARLDHHRRNSGQARPRRALRSGRV